MSIQIHEIINQFVQELPSNSCYDSKEHFIEQMLLDISTGLFYFLYIDLGRRVFMEYQDPLTKPILDMISVNRMVEELSPEALAAYNKDKETYPELFI